MRYKYLLLLIATGILFSCKKDKGTINQPSSLPLPPDPRVPTVLLKDIIIPNVPSPYYHFEYNADSTISFASFAADFKRYEVDYVGGRIREMNNNIGGIQEKLQYFYDNAGNVTAVNYFDLIGTLYIKVALSYDGKKLIKLERRRLLGNDFVVNKIMTFSYYDDGNLKEIIDQRPAVTGLQDESLTSDQFRQYDNKINVDGFSLIHNDFFDHLVLLPGVQFQKNNPGKEIFTSVANSYEVNYTYTYNDKEQPVTKDGEVIITAGSSTGQRFQTNSAFSYY